MGSAAPGFACLAPALAFLLALAHRQLPEPPLLRAEAAGSVPAAPRRDRAAGSCSLAGARHRHRPALPLAARRDRGAHPGVVRRSGRGEEPAEGCPGWGERRGLRHVLLQVPGMGLGAQQRHPSRCRLRGSPQLPLHLPWPADSRAICPAARAAWKAEEPFNYTVINVFGLFISRRLTSTFSIRQREAVIAPCSGCFPGQQPQLKGHQQKPRNSVESWGQDLSLRHRLGTGSASWPPLGELELAIFCLPSAALQKPAMSGAPTAGACGLTEAVPPAAAFPALAAWCLEAKHTCDGDGAAGRDVSLPSCSLQAGGRSLVARRERSSLQRAGAPLL